MKYNLSKNKIALAILIVIVIIFSVGIRVVLWDKVGANVGDLLLHFHDMKTHYENGTFPTMGAGFLGISNFGNTTTPRVPGSAFYLYYMICYAIGGGNLDNAIVVNFIFTLFLAFGFLFWIYKRFGLFVSTVIASLVFSNGYYMFVNFTFYNPNIPLIISFLFLPILAEYISKERNFIASILIFPLLALMAQGHFAVFHGLVPTVLVYMLIRYKHTLKNIVGLAISVFLAFLAYLPYLISEINSNFHNLNNVMQVAGGDRNMPIKAYIPRIQALVVFPTSEMSDHYDLEFFDFWKFDNTFDVILFILFMLIFITIISITIYSIVRFFRNKEFIYNTYREKDNKAFVLKELLCIYLLYFPVSILATVFLNGVSGPFRYHASVFTLSFVPLMTFLYSIIQNKKDRLIFNIFIFAAISTICLSILQYSCYERFDKKINWKNYRNAVTKIASNANGQKFSFTENSLLHVDLYKLGTSYNNEEMWNLSTNANIIYSVEFEGKNKLDTSVYTNATLIESNNIFVVHRIK